MLIELNPNECYYYSMTIRILVIDDLRSFRENVEPAGEVTYARTSQEALSILSEDIEGFQEIWFDHDLGEVDGRIDSTMPIVDWLSEKAFNDEPYNAHIFIHTSNPVGRQNINQSLTRWGYGTTHVDATQYFIV